LPASALAMSSAISSLLSLVVQLKVNSSAVKARPVQK
jgi:hypothetical protein